MKKLILIFCLIPASLVGQDFDFHAPLAKTEGDGFYRIQLEPEVVGRCQPMLEDLRLLNESGNQVPYVIQTENRLNHDEIFIEYPIVKLSHEDRKTYLIMENPDRVPISNVSMFIKNADSRKYARLSGSDDMEQWYVVRDHLCMQGGNSWNDVQEVKILNFPLIDYRYLKLKIYDCWVDPLNIVKVGSYDYQREEGLYINNPTVRITAVDDSIMTNTSMYRLQWDFPYQIDRLNFELEGATYFRRDAEILVKDVRQVSKRKWKSGATKTYDDWQRVENFTLSSASVNAIDVRLPAEREMYLRIYNQDNPPLEIVHLGTSQLDRQMVAHLDEKSDYSLAFGNAKMYQPQYDLAYFSDKMPDEMPGLENLGIRSLAEHDLAKNEESIDAKYLLWGVLGVIILFALFFTARMVKEVNLREAREG